VLRIARLQQEQPQIDITALTAALHAMVPEDRTQQCLPALALGAIRRAAEPATVALFSPKTTAAVRSLHSSSPGSE